ncbi:MAG TPA: hypothetical protein VKR31_01505 [Rhizomicrobium sp.]|nr:hypothetical protein [Rhizomicrobium sp.]
MIPLLAVVRVDGPMRFRLWLPLFLLWILLLPFALVLLPFALLLVVARGAAAWSVMRSTFEILSGMRGTHVEVSAPGNSVFVHIW